jgi:hypothetical protein
LIYSKIGGQREILAKILGSFIALIKSECHAGILVVCFCAKSNPNAITETIHATILSRSAKVDGNSVAVRYNGRFSDAIVNRWLYGLFFNTRSYRAVARVKAEKKLRKFISKKLSV